MRMQHRAAALAAAILTIAGAASARPQHAARVPLATARATALARVPGTVKSEELEKEHGRWIYSFDIRPAGATRRIVEEVNIDADTGALVGRIAVERE